MDITIDHRLSRAPRDVFSFVDDLSRYPAWMGLVHAVTEETTGADSVRAWSVELRAKVGPFARSKRLRMVRTVRDEPTHVRFERVELDGGAHGTWVLDVTLDGVDATHLTMSLHYGGRLWSAVVDRVLRDEVERSKARLSELVGD
jgi:Polyketide cyclase / dehydrase and lipid transport